MRTSSRGRLVAAALKRSWAETADPTVIFSESQLDEVTPLLYGSGAAGLGWWRIRATDLRETASGEMLHQAHRLLALLAAINENKIRRVFCALRGAGVEPILIKGWAMARLYPHTALRPYGDIDLIVRPGNTPIAIETAAKELRDCQLDFHGLPFELSERSIEKLFSRSQLVSCGDESVRVLSREDHFALLAVHLLKHGAWRPLWLCDLAVLLEAMSSDFDWEVCLGTDKRRANWILAAAGVARALLGVEIADARNSEQIPAPPEWLRQQVLKAWDTPFVEMQEPFRHRAPISFYLHRPGGLLQDLVRRWPDPIMATISVNGTFGRHRRLRYELGNWLLRTGRLFDRLMNPVGM
jgi:hypothetical protein